MLSERKRIDLAPAGEWVWPQTMVPGRNHGLRAIATALLFIGMLLTDTGRGTDASGYASGSVGQTPSSDVTAYELTVELIPESHQIAGTMTVDWRNTTDRAQDSLFFRLFPNAGYYGDGGTTVLAAAVDHAPVTPIERADPTVLEIPLTEPVPVGDHALIELAFDTVIPTPDRASFGVFGGSIETGWTLADWCPIVAGWEHDSGWYLAEPTPFGDPTFGDVAVYSVALTAPDTLHLVSSGFEATATPQPSAGTTRYQLVSGPGRDFTLTLQPGSSSSEFDIAEKLVEGANLRVTVPTSLAVPGLADAILRIAEGAFPVYASWLGRYDEPELDVTAADLSGAFGVSWNGLIWLDLSDIAADGVLSPEEETGLRFVLTHEVGHQWIGGIVGSNNNEHGFMTEGLTNELAVLVLRNRYGEVEAEHYLRSWVAGPYSAFARDGRDAVADEPLTSTSNVTIRSFAVYGKAALGFEVIRQEIGDPAFFAALDAYATDYRNGVSEPKDLLAAFETAANRDLSPVWSFWFETSDTTIDDVDAVLNGFAGS